MNTQKTHDNSREQNLEKLLVKRSYISKNKTKNCKRVIILKRYQHRTKLWKI